MITRLLDYQDVVKVFPKIHFIGIAGAGMSGLAEVMLTLGYTVSGSDLASNATTIRLQQLGAQIFCGHHAKHVLGTDCVVISAAIPSTNPELVQAQLGRIPIMPRAAMLAELMRFRRGIAVAGTHGKTTTTSLIAAVLHQGGIDPTFVIGGQLLAAGANARLGSSQWLVAEADESDGSFLRLNPLLAVVTNIDADHLENYQNDFSQIQAAFAEFLQRLPFYGLAVLCLDDPQVAQFATQIPRHVMTYGTDPAADVLASDIAQDGQWMHFRLSLPEGQNRLVRLAMPGQHNVLNALAAAAVGWQLGVDIDQIGQAFAEFAGVGRRFNDLGETMLPRGGKVRLIDDYGHHPRELAAVFAAVRGGWPERRLVVAFQPHRYSRTRDHLDAFAATLSTVDIVVLSEVYPAGESPIVGATAQALARTIRARGRREPVVVEHVRELPLVLLDVLLDGDILLMMGAGDIGHLAQEIQNKGLAGVQA